MHPGVPIDAADLQNISRLLGEGGEQLLAQSLHGFIQIGNVLLLVGLEPIPVVVHPDAPEKVHGFRRKACKHKTTPVSFCYVWLLLSCRVL